MVFGIDDALVAATGALKLVDTLAEALESQRESGDLDIERLIEEVRVTALERIDQADGALRQLERTLSEREVINLTLQEAIERTSPWKPFEAHRLKRIRKSLGDLSDAAYGAIDDIAALVRCDERAANNDELGKAVVRSSDAKRAFDARVRIAESDSVGATILVLREELARQKDALTNH